MRLHAMEKDPSGAAGGGGMSEGDASEFDCRYWERVRE